MIKWFQGIINSNELTAHPATLVEVVPSSNNNLLHLSSKCTTKPPDGHVDGALPDPQGGCNGPLHGVDVLCRAGDIQPALLVRPAKDTQDCDVAGTCRWWNGSPGGSEADFRWQTFQTLWCRRNPHPPPFPQPPDQVKQSRKMDKFATSSQLSLLTLPSLFKASSMLNTGTSLSL